jgi:hypothetical protein
MGSPTIRSIRCIGTGYLGGPTMVVISDRCPDVQVTVEGRCRDPLEVVSDPAISLDAKPTSPNGSACHALN